MDISGSIDSISESGGTFGVAETPTVDTAVDKIENHLDETGLFNDVTHNELQEINNTLKQLSSEQTNAVVSQLSDVSLEKWADEITSNGWLGTGGLSANERSELFSDLAAKLEPEQMARIHNASSDPDFRAELLKTTSRHWNTDGIAAAAENRLATLPAGSSRTELQTALAESRQLQDHTLMAVLAQDVYFSYAKSVTAPLAGNHLPPGVTLTRMSPGALQAELNIKQEQLVDDQSGFYAAVYKVEQQGSVNYIVAFRGTEDGTDWQTNAASLVTLTRQEELAGKLVETVVEADKGTVTVTGHSLGGGLANFAGLLHGVPSVTFNAKGITRPEMAAITQKPVGETLVQRAQRLVTNYQVNSEVLTGLQKHAPLIGGVAGTFFGGPLLGGIVAVQTDKVVREAPGVAIEIPAIRPDGKEGNMLLETAAKIATLSSPVAHAVLGEVDISGPVDRHGMDYVLEGMEHLSDAANQQLLEYLFHSYTSGQPLQNGYGLNWIAP